MQMEMFIKDNGKTIKLMDMVFILELMTQAILDSGQKICSMAMAYKNGMMDHLTKGSIFKDLSKELENSFGLMAQCTRVISRKI